MSLKVIKQQLKEIKKGTIFPVYFIEGTEKYSIDLLTKTVVSKIESLDNISSQNTTFYGKEANLEEILMLCRNVPMFCTYQVILIKEAQHLSDITKSKYQDALISYISHPNKNTILIFNFKNKSLDKKTRLYKALKAKDYIYTFNNPYDYQLPDWIREFAHAKNLKISNDAVRMLIEFIGSDIQILFNEMEKLVLCIDKDKEINMSDIYKFVGINKDYNVFEFQKALVSNDLNKARKILNYYINNSIPCDYHIIIPSLYNFFSKLLSVKLSKSKSPSEMATALSINRYFINDYIKASKYFTYKKLIGLINIISTMDCRVKNINYGSSNNLNIFADLSIKLFEK